MRYMSTIDNDIDIDIDIQAIVVSGYTHVAEKF